MIEADIVTRLKATSAVTAIVGQRIYPAPAPEVATLPNVTWQQIADRPSRVADGVLNLRRTRYQLNVWSETALQAISLAAAVRASMDSWESAVVQMAVTDNVTDLFDGDFSPARWGRALDVTIVHKE
jgi:hypothetical protein